MNFDTTTQQIVGLCLVSLILGCGKLFMKSPTKKNKSEGSRQRHINQQGYAEKKPNFKRFESIF